MVGLIYLLGVIAFLVVSCYLIKKDESIQVVTIFGAMFLLIASASSWLGVIVSLFILYGDKVIYRKSE